MANGHGGKRHGAGRPHGSRNRATLAQIEAARTLPTTGTPLDFLRAVLNHEGLSNQVRVMAARALMPYV
jgi:hypothetical protein